MLGRGLTATFRALGRVFAGAAIWWAPARPRGRLAVALGAGVIVFATAAAATFAATITTSVTAAQGATSATFEFRETSWDTYLASGMALTIRLRGKPLYARRVSVPVCGGRCVVGDAAGSVLDVRELEPGRTPDVILTLADGGNHCCVVTQVYRYDPAARAYRMAERSFATPGPYLESERGRLVFVAADARFVCQFAACADEGLPIQIWSFATGRFVDVTRSFPGQVAEDAASWYGAYLEVWKRGFGLGFLAAWAADEDLLGHSELVRNRLAALKAEHRLRTPFSSTAPGFIAQLQRFLAKNGYTH